MLPNCVGDGGIIDIAGELRWHMAHQRTQFKAWCCLRHWSADRNLHCPIDYHVISKYCQKCETTGKKMEELGPDAYEVWFREHQPDCKKNFEGSSGMMEVEGARRLWTRSVAQHKLRYTTMLSDGDCKTFNELQNERPYGDVLIKKEECVNHVSKRMGTALRNLITDNKKRGVTLGGRGEGQLKNQTVQKPFRSTTPKPSGAARQWRPCQMQYGPPSFTAHPLMRILIMLGVHRAQLLGVFTSGLQHAVNLRWLTKATPTHQWTEEGSTAVVDCLQKTVWSWAG